MNWRALTPLGWAALILTGLVVCILVAGSLGLRWDPLGLGARRLKAAQTQAAAAQADASARRLEVEGAAGQADRLDALHQRLAATERATATVAALARNAPDATIPLDPDRAARLVGHDRELCRLSPAVCDAAATDSAPSGADALSSGPPA